MLGKSCRFVDTVGLCFCQIVFYSNMYPEETLKRCRLLLYKNSSSLCNCKCTAFTMHWRCYCLPASCRTTYTTSTNIFSLPFLLRPISRFPWFFLSIPYSPVREIYSFLFFILGTVHYECKFLICRFFIFVTVLFIKLQKTECLNTKFTDKILWKFVLNLAFWIFKNCLCRSLFSNDIKKTSWDPR